MRVYFSKFYSTTFNLFWLFADQYQMILPNTMQNSIIGVCSMVVIAVLLIPQPLCSIWVALAIFSMDSGVIGFMTWWGVNLDAISMITIVMSTGFCVDFSAHIAYGYVISDEELPAKRVCQTLAALGWPIVQGASSTILGVIALATVDAYMIRTFFKTVFLVIVIGVIHGLVFLPVLLSIFVRRATCFDKKLRQRKVEPAESIGLPDEDDPLPYGRYGIYLPRLTHMTEYYHPSSKGGDVLHWYHAQNHHNPLQRHLSAVAVLMPHPSMSRIPSAHSLASMHIVPPPPVMGTAVFPIVYGAAHPATMFFGPPAPPPISARSTPETKHRQRILQPIPTVRQLSVGSHSLGMSKSSEDLSKHIHQQGPSGISLGGLHPGVMRASSVTPGASRKSSIIRKSSMILNSSSSARASSRKHSQLRRKISDSEAEVLRAAAGRLMAGIPQFQLNPDGSWSAFYPGQYPSER